MRSAVALLACSLLTLSLACTEKRIVVQAAPAPEEQAEEKETPSSETESDAGSQPSPTDPLFLDLGEVQVGTNVTFDVPEGALGFNITAEGQSADFDPQAPFGIQRITDPSGKIVHDNYGPKGATTATSIALYDLIATASVPQGDGVGPDLAGKWTLRLGVWNSSAKPKLRVKVRIQSSGDGQFHGGQLDLHIHVPDGVEINGRRIDPAKAVTDSAIKERLDTFFELSSGLLGLERGKVVFSEAPGSFAEIDGMKEVLAGFAVSKGEKDGTQVLHVLMTNSITDNGEPIAAGIAAGIPGAATIFGRGVSGIIVTSTSSVDQDAITMLHETGHFFGLNHTTEFSGEHSDPLSDTPECTGISMDPQVLMECPDADNILFAAGPISGAPHLSATQKRVYRGSPIYKAFGKDSATTMAYEPPGISRSLQRQYRLAGGTRLSPVERELAMGFCGLTPLDTAGLVKRYGEAQAIAQLRAAAADTDLAAYIRGRANLALTKLGAK